MANEISHQILPHVSWLLNLLDSDGLGALYTLKASLSHVMAGLQHCSGLWEVVLVELVTPLQQVPKLCCQHLVPELLPLLLGHPGKPVFSQRQTGR